jgi:hypothetical protein
MAQKWKNRNKQKRTAPRFAAIASANPPEAPSFPAFKPGIVALQAAVIIALGVWIYWPSLHGLWLWDDDFLLQQNAYVHDPNGLWYIWTDPEHALIDFFPLTVSFEWLIWQICSPNQSDPTFAGMTVYYHVTSLVLHLVSAMMIWHLFRRLGIRLAWLGALIFTVHPAIVESVSWMAELKNTVAMPPFLLAVLAWIKYDRARKWEYYVLALLFYIIAMLCKSSMAMFPVIILLYAWWKHGRVGFWDHMKSPLDFESRVFRAILEFIPNFIPTIPFFIIAGVDAYFLIIYLRHGVGEQFIPGLLGGPLGRTACAGLSLLFYFSKCLLPANLMPIYPQWVVNPPDFGYIWLWPVLAVAFAGLWWWRMQLWARLAGYGITFFLLITLPLYGWLGQFWPWLDLALGFCWLLKRREQPWARAAIFGFGYFFLMIVPFVGWRAISFMRFGWVMDHFLYVPIIGLIGLAAAAAGDLYDRLPRSTPAWRIAAVSMTVGVVGLFTVGSHDYAKVFVNRLVYWTYSADRNYVAWPAHNNRGNQLLDYAQSAQNRGEQALSDAKAAEAAGFTDEARNLAQKAEQELGEAQSLFSKSEQEFRIALALNPVYTEAHNNLGYILSKQGRYKEAEAEFRTALKYTPDFESAQRNLAQVLKLENAESPK